QVAVESSRPHGLEGRIPRQGGNEERARIPGLARIVLGVRQTAVVGGQRLAIEDAEGDEQMGAVVADSVQTAELLVVLGVGVDGLQVERELEALEVAAGDEVHHPRYRFRSIQRCRAVLEKLYPLERDHR